MVHALKEAWRVLVPRGVLVDVRPLSLNTPLEIIYEGCSEIAGIVDMSPGLAYDRDVDRAIEVVTTDRLYTETWSEYFSYTYYWKTIKGMQEDIKENWQGEVIITNEVWQQARALIKKLGPKAKLRLAAQMKLALYLKQG